MPEAKRKPRSQPAWTDIKTRLAGFDRRGLMGLIQDLYAAQKDNQTFLHARFGVGSDALPPCKETLDRWLWPDVLRNQDTSVVKAKQAISSYKKAVGDPSGLAELMVFYCERAARFSNDLDNQDEGYFDALVRMFEQVLKAIGQLPAPDRDVLIARLDRVRVFGRKPRLSRRRRYGFPARRTLRNRPMSSQKYVQPRPVNSSARAASHADARSATR